MDQRNIIRWTAVLGALSVGLGAFGAHGLETLVTPDRLEIFHTGVRYSFYHTFALGLAAALYPSPSVDTRRLAASVWLWLIGTLLFSGSLYLLSLREVHGLPVGFLGPVTPIGGLLLIGGWISLFFSPTKNAASV
ncbi:DUF423 domain-containing protein [Lewinella sp. IMCC34191]|uniref:DUF423 domain-containing protein n=1 Tax=Lewinella sp. IMCC34191 TaxID=2259172 RepID=UPI000E251A23|nr:DUF423 domain-containing protein [Lewinella sp. IMCC34191]